MLLLEGVEVHVREDAFKSCLRRHMDWLDELVIDADDNTWFRWMSRRQTKDQRREPQIHQMSGDGNAIHIDENQPKTRQKRQFEVQSNVLKAAKRHRGAAAVLGTLPQQQQSQTMTASSGNLDTRFQQQRTPLFTRKTSTVEPAPSGVESPIILLQSATDLKPSVTNVVSQQQLNGSENVVSSTATAPVISAPPFKQLELANSAASGEKVEKYSEQLRATNTATLPFQQSHDNQGYGSVKKEPIKIEPIETSSGSDDDEDYSTQQIVQQQQQQQQQQHDPQPGTSGAFDQSGVGDNVPREPLPSVRLSGLPSQEVSTEGQLIPMKSSGHNSEKLTGNEPIQTGKKQFKCPKCEQCFGQSKSCKQYLEDTHERPLKCSMCERRFLTSSKRSKHMKSDHRNEKFKSFKCEVCDEEITTRTNWEQHERKHVGIYPFKCLMCEQCFTQCKSYKQHMKMVHPDENYEEPFKCPMCEDYFSKRSRRNKHMKRVHTNENFKPFKCKFCDKEIECCEKWEPHERKHLGENPFKCPRCEKCFPDRSACKRHVKTVHIKPFKCQFCEKEIKSHEELEKHERLHVHAKLFQCLMCEQRFTHKRSRKFHMKSIHKIEPNTSND
ncbi:uncharacterized protein LOC141909526 [Tubulanus polymorphus]|uniref:uncharacterized protein LOC141909526 n=1 Tax=Tubulanus polymorphus TaxID=672921 RepID=UPI003DA404A4